MANDTPIEKPTIPKDTRVRNLVGFVQKDPTATRYWVRDEVEEHSRLAPLLDQYNDYNYIFRFGACERPDIDGIVSDLHGMSSGYAGSLADLLPIIPSLE